MELRDYVRLLGRYWALLLALAVLGAGGGYLAAVLQPPTYSAATRVFVSVSAGQTTSDLVQGSDYTLSRVQSYASLANSQRVLEQVIVELGLAVSWWDLAEQIDASIEPETTIIQITVESGGAASAALLADTTAARLADTVVDIESRGLVLPSPVELSVVEQARVPQAPSSPVPWQFVGVGGVLALLLAIVIALLREALDTTVRSERDLRAVADAPLLGAIAFDQKASKRPLAVHTDPNGARAESFRALRTSLRFVEVDERSHAFIITSPLAGMGKSTTVANLGLALADAGERVVVVDADLRRPRLAEYMGLDGTIGVTDVLIGAVDLADALQPWGSGPLAVLPAGQVPPNPSEMLGSQAMVSLITQLRAEFEWVLFDTPPMLPVTDAAVLGEQVDASLLVVAAGRARRQQVEAALERLSRVGASIGGVVLTMVPTRGVDAAGYEAYAAYASGAGDAQVALGAPVLEPARPKRKGGARPAGTGASVTGGGAGPSKVQGEGVHPEPAPPVPGRTGGRRPARGAKRESAA